MSKMLLHLPACITQPIEEEAILDLSHMGVGIRKAEVFTWCRNRDKEYSVSFVLGISDQDDDLLTRSFTLHSNNGETRPFVIDVTAGNKSLNGLGVQVEGATDVYLSVFIRELGSNPAIIPVEAYGDGE